MEEQNRSAFMKNLYLMAHQDLSPFKELPIYTILQQRKVIAKRILDGKKENLEVYEEMIEYANQLLKDYFGI